MYGIIYVNAVRIISTVVCTRVHIMRQFEFFSIKSFTTFRNKCTYMCVCVCVENGENDFSRKRPDNELPSNTMGSSNFSTTLTH